MIDEAELDRRVAAMALELRTRARSLEGGIDDEVRFRKDASSRATFVALSERASDPISQGLRAWVGWLTIERVTSDDAVRAALARHEPIEDPSTGAVASNAILARSLVGPVEREARSAAAKLGALDRGATDALRRLADRRAEAARLLFDGRADEHLAALVDPSAHAGATAVRVLEATQQAFDAVRCSGDWLDVVRASVAADAGEGWPARMTPRWFIGLFDKSDLFRGVSLGTVRMPEPRGASSFVRALGRIGSAWAWADRPTAAPFSLVRSPNDSMVLRDGALFAMLPLEPSFHERKLALGRDRARRQAEAIARAALVWVRMLALRTLAWPLLRAPSGARDFEDVSERALGRPIPSRLLGITPWLASEDGAHLSSLLDALALRERLRERFDVDWFDNPRAHEALRHQHHLPVRDRTTIEPEEAARALENRVRELLASS